MAENRLKNAVFSCFKRISAKTSLVALLSTVGPSTEAEPISISEDESLGLILAVNLDLSDGVSGGCWNNSATILAKMRLLLEQNAIRVEAEPLAFLNLFGRSVSLSVWGYRSGDVCVGAAEFEVLHWSTSTLGPFEGGGEYTIWGLSTAAGNSAVYNSYTDLDDQLADFFEVASTDFVARVLAGRRSEDVSGLFASYPNLKEGVLTTRQLEELLSRARSSD